TETKLQKNNHRGGHLPQTCRGMCLILWIHHLHADDGSRGFRECAGWHALLSSASPNSSRRSAPACRAVRVHYGESREMETCPYSERGKAIARVIRRLARTKLAGSSCCLIRVVRACASRSRNRASHVRSARQGDS